MDYLISEHGPVIDLARRFVDKELMPYEPAVLQREAQGGTNQLDADELKLVDAKARDYGLWGLDVPTELGGSNLPAVALVGVDEMLGRTAIFYILPPDAPNLHMLLDHATEIQRERYLHPYARGDMTSGIAVSEPGAGGDPAAMTTRAERVPGGWKVNGRKIWISKALEADFLIMMARTGSQGDGRNSISAFIVDRGTKGFNVLRRIPMVGGMFTYEIAIEDCFLPDTQLLGPEGAGFAPLQKRFSLRRVQMGAWCVGMAQRALDMMTEYAPQRRTFGKALSERQAIQWWVADAATKIHAARLMVYDAAWKLDQGRSIRTEASMIKVFAAEMATEVIDHAMQTFGAMGLSKELPLPLMASTVRWIRMGEGPSEVHRALIARSLM